MKKKVFIVFSLVLVIFFSCSNDDKKLNDSLSLVNQNIDDDKNIVVRKNKIKIASWNLQTFFDSQEDGVEFSEFIGTNSKWTKEKYYQRIKRLCNIIEHIDADIFVMQELENQDIIYDISNNLKNQGRVDKAYSYACFGKDKLHSFGCGLLSRYEITNELIHQIEIHDELDLIQPQLRPLIQTEVLVNNSILTIFICHWKSKAGIADECSKWRDEQEKKLLHEVLKVGDNPVIVCGDFNQQLVEFKQLPFSKMNSCWNYFKLESNKPLGTYFYNNSWEKIDHLFLNSKVECINFSIYSGEDLLTETNIPFRYSVWNGQGYSDHLPIVGEIIF